MKMIIWGIIVLSAFVCSCSSNSDKTQDLRDVKGRDALIDAMFPFVDSLLVRYGEFFPISAALTKDGKIATVATYDGNERPLSDDVIRDLKKALKLGADSGEYVAAVIFYDVRAVSPWNDRKTDAVVVHFESARDTGAKKYFCPYTLSGDRVLSYSEGWSNEVQKEVFK